MLVHVNYACLRSGCACESGVCVRIMRACESGVRVNQTCMLARANCARSQVCARSCVRRCSCTHASSQVRACVLACARVCVLTCVHVYPRLCVRVRACMLACVYTHVRVRVCAFIFFPSLGTATDTLPSTRTTIKHLLKRFPKIPGFGKPCQV